MDALQRLRIEALLACVAGFLAASAIPAVVYSFVFQYDPIAVGTLQAVAWGHWGTAFFACAVGLLAHASGSIALTALHCGAGFMLGAALGGFNTAFWWSLAARCQTLQMAYDGCLDCACAASNSCTAADLAADGSCSSCSAYPIEVCSAVAERKNYFLLAFTGLTTVLTLAIPAVLSLLILVRTERAAGEKAARRHLVAFTVDQQTTLVSSGDKPTITPAQLSAYVSLLLESGDAEACATAEKCRSALAERGFDLPVIVGEPPAGSKKKQQGGKKGAGSGGMAAVVVTAAAEDAAAPTPAAAAALGRAPSGKAGGGAMVLTASGSLSPFATARLDDLAFAEAESGRRPAHKHQVAAEPQLYPSVQR